MKRLAVLLATLLATVTHAADWQASASDQVKATLRQQGTQQCLDYDFNGVSGYAVLRRSWPQDWPANFALHTQLSGQGAGNELQMKLVDASGDNVWWVTRPGFAPTAQPQATEFKQRQIQFAWGPAADRQLRRTEFLEWVVVAAAKGARRGSLCVAPLSVEPRAAVPATAAPPRTTRQPGLVQIDLQAPRELSGLRIDWPQAPGRYRIETSDDGRHWHTQAERARSAAGTELQYLGELETRWLRLRFPPKLAAPRVQLRSLIDWPSRDAMLQELAKQLPEGDLPRAYRGQQNYWTLVGVDGGGATSGLLSEDGAIELHPGGPSLEPALLLADGRLLTWAQVSQHHSLQGGHLPMPRVHWRHPEVALDIEAGADGTPAQPGLMARYTVRNPGPHSLRVSLLLAARPWQVNPPQQFLNLRGGVSPIEQLRWDGLQLHIAGHGLVSSLRPTAVQAQPFAAGMGLRALLAAPKLTQLDDPQGLASGLLRYDLELPPGGEQTVGFVTALDSRPPGACAAVIQARAGASCGANLDAGEALDGHQQRAGNDEWPRKSPRPEGLVPEGGRSGVAPLVRGPTPDGALRLASPPFRDQRGPGLLPRRLLDLRFERAAEAWQQRLGTLQLSLPPAAGPLADRMRAALAQILVSRDGPWLRPGTRSYARSWIRDGAMMVAALLRMGEVQAAREFVDAYQGILFENGKVPCCHDARGADPVVENDSHGQYLYAVAEVWRHTQDERFLARHWPAVQRTVAYIDRLRQSERTAANQTPERARFFGLMPPSISHEGYSDKPAYAYWDNFWTLRGLKDAVQMARALQSPLASSYAAQLAEFERDLAASVRATAQHYGQSVIAGAADRGDFDPTSTTVLLNPAQGEALVPSDLLSNTFERYLREARERTAGTRPYKDYTPYELRNVSALVRLGWADAAHELLGFFYRDARPDGWHQWAEVVLPDAREPRFLGDMPHAWISADFLRAALDLLAYERESSGDLILGAGLTTAWRASGPFRIAGLSTAYGRLDYRLLPQATGWRLHIDHRPERLPGQLRLAWPGTGPLPRATADGQPLPWDGRELPLPATHATIDLVTP